MAGGSAQAPFRSTGLDHFGSCLEQAGQDRASAGVAQLALGTIRTPRSDAEAGLLLRHHRGLAAKPAGRVADDDEHDDHGRNRIPDARLLQIHWPGFPSACFDLSRNVFGVPQAEKHAIRGDDHTPSASTRVGAAMGNQTRHIFCDVGSRQSKARNRQTAYSPRQFSSRASRAAPPGPRAMVARGSPIRTDRRGPPRRCRAPAVPAARSCSLRLPTPCASAISVTESFLRPQQFFLRFHHLLQVERHKTTA